MISISQFVRNSQLWCKVSNSQVWHKVTKSLNCCQHPFFCSLHRPENAPSLTVAPPRPRDFAPAPAPPQPEFFSSVLLRSKKTLPRASLVHSTPPLWPWQLVFEQLRYRCMHFIRLHTGSRPLK